MKRFQLSLGFLLFLTILTASAQKDSVNTLSRKQKRELKRLKQAYNPLSPSKAAFYSAIFPGGGQIYNKKYWKVPLAWAAVGIPVYFYLDNNSEYKRYRRAFKQRRAGLQDEFTLDGGVELISTDGLISAQRTLQNNRDLSLLITVIGYVLQVVEASVNAHLIQFNTNNDLSFRPVLMDMNQFQAGTPTFGLKLTYKLK